MFGPGTWRKSEKSRLRIFDFAVSGTSTLSAVATIRFQFTMFNRHGKVAWPAPPWASPPRPADGEFLGS